jgi:hypothetical protein
MFGQWQPPQMSSSQGKGKGKGKGNWKGKGKGGNNVSVGNPSGHPHSPLPEELHPVIQTVEAAMRLIKAAKERITPCHYYLKYGDCTRKNCQNIHGPAATAAAAAMDKAKTAATPHGE